LWDEIEDQSMSRRSSLREEIDELRRELESVRSGLKTQPETPDAGPKTDMPQTATAFERQITELNRLVEAMLDEAEDTVAEHPVATVAGALALGIVIGRLTAR
jgi:ElaB/YqjD/DUF883 family membrane-anchored ribosome-binding protein